MKRFFYILIFFPFIIYSQGWDNIQIASTKVKENIFFLEGRGGNIGVLLGDDGALIIDDQFAQLSDKIKSAVKEISGKEITYVMNTHYHGDHTGGNENFKNSGATIIGHSNVRERLGITFENVALRRTMQAKPESYWPDVTFSSDSSFSLYGEEINLVYLPEAHTDGDALVYFKTSNIIHAGDCFVRYGFPYIDISAGGTIDGIISAHEKILSIADENTVIMPGHGKLAGINDVKEVLTMLKESKEIVSKAKDEGIKLGDLIAQKPLDKYHERWSGNFINSDLFVQLIYESL